MLARAVPRRRGSMPSRHCQRRETIHVRQSNPKSAGSATPPMVKMLVIGILIAPAPDPPGDGGLAGVGAPGPERRRRPGRWPPPGANSQLLAGPVLTVPYIERVKDDKGKTVSEILLLRPLPAREAGGRGGRRHGATEPRHLRGGRLPHRPCDGRAPSPGPISPAGRSRPRTSCWQDAYLSVGVPDMRGITSGVRLDWGNRTLQLAPGGGEEGLWTSGLRTPIPGLAESKPGGGLRLRVRPGPQRQQARSPSSPSARRRGWTLQLPLAIAQLQRERSCRRAAR